MKNNFFLFENTKTFDQKKKLYNTSLSMYAYIYDMTENIAHQILFIYKNWDMHYIFITTL